MKNYIAVLAIIFLTGVGCKKLELIPVSQKSVEGFYQNEEQLNQAVIGCYSNFQNLWVNSSYSYGLTEARSDNAFQGVAYNDGDISRFSETSLNALLFQAWSAYYNTISRCNHVLESLKSATVNDQQKKQFEGEAKFLRALCYFDLVRYFGGVPKISTVLSIDEAKAVGRSSAEDIYDLIVSDLTDATSLLPDEYDTKNKGRATKWAAKGYLGKVYIFRSGYPLKKNEWNLAQQQFLDIKNSNRFEIFTNYADIYKYENEGGKQQIFSIQFIPVSGQGNTFPGRNAPNTISPKSIAEGGFPYGGSPNNLFLTSDLVNSYEQDDLRRDIAIRTSWLNNTNTIISDAPFLQKYQNGPVLASTTNWGIDWIALSYTDVLLMYAEALNELGYVADGDAFKILNEIRARAGLSSKTSADIATQQDFRLATQQERRHEFCGENIRWFDLVRTDRAYDVMRAYLSQYNLSNNFGSKDRYIYPIPQTVIDVTPGIAQNPGY